MFKGASTHRLDAKSRLHVPKRFQELLGYSDDGIMRLVLAPCVQEADDAGRLELVGERVLRALTPESLASETTLAFFRDIRWDGFLRDVSVPTASIRPTRCTRQSRSPRRL